MAIYERSINISIWKGLDPMAITVSSVKNKNQLTRHINGQSDFDVVNITYGSKSELVSALATQTQQPNKTMGLILVSLKGTPNVDG